MNASAGTLDNLKENFRRLAGRLPTDAELTNLARVGEALGLRSNDALWMIIFALEHYKGLYETVPATIKEASAFVLQEHTAALRARLDEAEANSKAKLEDYAAGLLAEIKKSLEKELSAVAKDTIEKQASLAVRDAFYSVSSRLEQAAGAAEKATASFNGSRRKTLLLGMVLAAVIAGAISAGAMMFLPSFKKAGTLGTDKQEAQALGEAVQEIWPRIPASTQRLIKDATRGK